jgi:hypothetical protein
MAPGVSELLKAGDPAGVAPMLAPAVIFHSPVAEYQGRDDVAHLFSIIGHCLDALETRVEYAAGPRSASEFTARVRGRHVDGVLVLELDAGDMVAEATLLLRPLHALLDAVAFLRDALAVDPLPSTRRHESEPPQDPGSPR